MFSLGIAILFTALVGAAIDTSMAVTSSVYEVHRNNPTLTFDELFASGLSIASDILGTTVNTLLFAFIAGSFSLFILYKDLHYSFTQVINSKAFVQEAVMITLSCISCVLVIPISALIISNKIKKST